MAETFWGPGHKRAKFFSDFAEFVMTEMGGTLAITMDDAINWSDYNKIKYLTSLARLDNETIRANCMRLDLTVVHQTAAALRAASDRQAEPKSESQERDGRRSREHSR